MTNKKKLLREYALLLIITIVFAMPANLFAQETVKKDISKMTREEVLQMTDDEILQLSLEDLAALSEKVGLTIDELVLAIQSGGKGGFGRQLEALNAKVYIHGFAVFNYYNIDFNRKLDKSSFNLHYFNPMIGVNIKDKIIAEVMLEYEHGGETVGIRYSTLDYAFSKYLTLRVGKFLMPMGRFNEYLYPEYINILAARPMSHWYILPSVWTEVGAQLRGHLSFTDDMDVNYALYVVNGLEQKDGKYGGNTRDMRDNFRDKNNDNKAIGGRIGFKLLNKIEMGYSYYQGAYSKDGKMNLAMHGADAEFKSKHLTLRGEYLYAIEDTLDGNIEKKGFFLESAYRINKYFEPAIRYEQAEIPKVTGMLDIDGDGTKDFFIDPIQRVNFGIIFYPEPDLHSRFNFKVNYNFIANNGQGKPRDEYIVQVNIGF